MNIDISRIIHTHTIHVGCSKIAYICQLYVYLYANIVNAVECKSAIVSKEMSTCVNCIEKMRMILQEILLMQ